MNARISAIILLLTAVNSVSSFSSIPRKPSPKRSRRGASSSSLTTTRRVFGFVLAGGAHKMFSTMNRPANAKQAGASTSEGATSSTSLNYRTFEETEESAVYELRDKVDMNIAALEQGPLLTSSFPSDADIQEEMDMVEAKKSKAAESELVETAKAFLPVVIEIGVIAVVAGTRQL